MLIVGEATALLPPGTNLTLYRRRHFPDHVLDSVQNTYLASTESRDPEGATTRRTAAHLHHNKQRVYDVAPNESSSVTRII